MAIGTEATQAATAICVVLEKHEKHYQEQHLEDAVDYVERYISSMRIEENSRRNEERVY